MHVVRFDVLADVVHPRFCDGSPLHRRRRGSGQKVRGRPPLVRPRRSLFQTQAHKSVPVFTSLIGGNFVTLLHAHTLKSRPYWFHVLPGPFTVGCACSGLILATPASLYEHFLPGLPRGEPGSGVFRPLPVVHLWNRITSCTCLPPPGLLPGLDSREPVPTGTARAACAR